MFTDYYVGLLVAVVGPIIWLTFGFAIFEDSGVGRRVCILLAAACFVGGIWTYFQATRSPLYKEATKKQEWRPTRVGGTPIGEFNQRR